MGKSIEQNKVADLDRKRRSKSIGEIPALLFNFAIRNYGEETFERAWHELFCDELEMPFDTESEFSSFFFPWFFYDYKLSSNKTIVETMLNSEEKVLDDLQAEYMEKSIKSPLSFFQVIDVDKGYGLKVRDLFTKKEFEVSDRAASSSILVGEIVFARVVSVTTGYTVIGVCSPFPISPADIHHILRLRKGIMASRKDLSKEHLIRFNSELLNLYRCFISDLVATPNQIIVNSDNEEIIHLNMHYNIKSPERAFNALYDLNCTESKKMQLTNAKSSPKGKLLEIEIPWLKAGSPTSNPLIYGVIYIKNKQLNVYINSEERADRINNIINEKLGNYAKLVDITEAEPDVMENEAPSVAEAQAAVETAVEEHWKNWPTMKLPALDNRSPKQACQSKDGKEAVKGMLRSFEISMERDGDNNISQEILCNLRAILKID